MDYESEHAPIRRCARCRVSAHCTRVETRTYLLFPISTTHWYQCPKCQGTFGIESNGGIAFFAIAGTGFLVLGAAGIQRVPTAAFAAVFGGLAAIGYAAHLIWVRRTNERVPD